MKLEEMGVLMSQAIMPHLASHSTKGGLQRLLGWCLRHTINNTTEKGDTQNTLFQDSEYAHLLLQRVQTHISKKSIPLQAAIVMTRPKIAECSK